MSDQASTIFLESPDEADSQPLLPKAASSGLSKVIALNPRTRAHLRRRGQEADSTLPYLTAASRERALKRSIELTRWLRDHFGFEDNWGVRDAYAENLVWYTRGLLDYLLWSLEVLNSAVEQHNARDLWVHVPDSKDVSGPRSGLKDRYFGTVASRFAAAKGLEVRPISIRRTFSKRRIVDGVALGFAKAVASSPPLAWLHRRQLLRLRSRRPALFTSHHYRMNVLAGRMQREHGVVPVLLSDWSSRPSPRWPLSMTAVPPFTAEARIRLLEPLAHEDRASLRRLEEAIQEFASQIDKAGEVFSYLGVPFADVVAHKVRSGIGPFLVELHRRGAALHMLLDVLRPSMVFSNGSRIDDVMIGELCRAASIPAMIVSHGSHPPPSNEAERHEWGEHGRRLIGAPYQYTALQSPLAEEFHKLLSLNGARGVRTGPLIWATVDKSERSIALRHRMLGDGIAERVIVHAGTSKGVSEKVRFHVYETPDEYLQSIRDLVQAVGQVPRVRLIIMFRPSDHIGLEDLKTLVSFSEKAMVSVGEPLVEVLGFTDLLVSFSSTVIEEALQNRIPVLLYGGEGRYQHVPAASVFADATPGPSAVYHVKERQDLPYALGYILDTCAGQRLDDKLFAPYVYQPEQLTPMSEFLGILRGRHGN